MEILTAPSHGASCTVLVPGRKGFITCKEGGAFSKMTITTILSKKTCIHHKQLNSLPEPSGVLCSRIEGIETWVSKAKRICSDKTDSRKNKRDGYHLQNRRQQSLRYINPSKASASPRNDDIVSKRRPHRKQGNGSSRIRNVIGASLFNGTYARAGCNGAGYDFGDGGSSNGGRGGWSGGDGGDMGGRSNEYRPVDVFSKFEEDSSNDASLEVQSKVSHVLASLSSSHFESSVAQPAEKAHLDVYISPGTSVGSWDKSVTDADKANEAEEDHIQSYKGKALIDFGTRSVDVEVEHELDAGSHDGMRDTNMNNMYSPGAATSGKANGISGNDIVRRSQTGSAISTLGNELPSSFAQIQEAKSMNPYNANMRRESSGSFFNWVRKMVDSVLGSRKDVEERRLLVNELAELVLKIIYEKEGDAAFARKSEIGALKRLQREAFADLLKMKGKIDKLERPGPGTSGLSNTQLRGEVTAGGAFILMQDAKSSHARSSLVQAGLQTGLDVRFTFETSFRERDVLVTECTTGQGMGNMESDSIGGPLRLGKVSYEARISDELMLIFSPLGAEAKDILEVVNPLQGQAVTKFAGGGPALFNDFKGSAFGATFKNLKALLSLSQCLSGWGNCISSSTSRNEIDGPLCLGTLAQCIYQPSEHMIFSISALNRIWPSPPLPSSSGLHWSELGPLVLSKSFSSSESFRDSTATSFSRLVSQGGEWDIPNAEALTQRTSMQSLAFSAEVDLGTGMSAGGWMQMDRGGFQTDYGKQSQWCLSLAKSTGSKLNWGVAAGKSMPGTSFSTQNAENFQEYQVDPAQPQLQFESFIRLDCGRGFILQPGLLYVLDTKCQTPAFTMKAHWTL